MSICDKLGFCQLRFIGVWKGRCEYLSAGLCILFTLKKRFLLPSWISLNSLVFTIRQQFVNRKPKPTFVSSQVTFNLPHHIDMV